MDSSRDYRVADHLFRITADEAQLALLTNYAPFMLEQLTDEAKVFELQIVSEPAPELELRHIFTDTSDDDMPRIEIYRQQENGQDTGWVICVSMFRESDIVCRLHATASFEKATLYIGTRDVRFAIDNAAMLLYAFTTVPLATLEMHSSVIKREGRAYMFLGKSGTGKSTHSRQWLELFEDAELLNDDNPIVRLLDEDGKKVVRVYGSPWSGKTPCYKQDNAPVQAIVKLSQAPKNEIRPLRLPEAYAYMLSSSSGLKILPEMMDALYATISTLIQTIQLYGLECLPNTDAAAVCYQGVNP